MSCPHRPACPATVTRWVCEKRTQVEQAITKGILTRAEGVSLMGKYGVTLSPVIKVYQGHPVVREQGELL